MIVAVVVIGMFWQRTRASPIAPLVLDQTERVLLVESGDGFNAVLGKLREQGVYQGRDLEWKALAGTLGVAGRLQVGEYAITSGLTPRVLLLRLAKGEVIQRKFTIVEGWSFRDLRAALVSRRAAGASDRRVERCRADGQAGPRRRASRRPLPAGDLRLHPRHRRARVARSRREGDGRGAGRGLGLARRRSLPLQSADELLTLASIVEKETGLASERPQIAGVFVRRLKLGMRLQTDPTVIYGMGSAYAGNIRRPTCETDTPYNTYTRAGLPPTPIAMPGKAALEAVAHPADGDALYFVARGNGAHYFSANLAEHNAAVRKYQLRAMMTPMKHRGMLISIEGGEGAGKSTVLHAVRDAARRSRAGCRADPRAGWHGLRRGHPRAAARSRGRSPGAETELLLMFAARAQLVARSHPARDRARRRGAHRPLHRCQLRLPGRWARHRHGIDRRARTLGRGHQARPDPAAGRRRFGRAWRGPARAAPRRTASRTSRWISSSGSGLSISRAPPPSRSGSGSSMPRKRPMPCWTRWARR